MKVKNLFAVLFLTTFAFSSAAMAEGSGRMTVSGSIIKTQTSCAIAPESIDQTVTLGQVADAALLENNGSGKSVPQHFNIRLEDCEVSGGNSVTVTFVGVEGKEGRLGITGTASGASVALADGSGNVLELGKPSKSISLQNGNNILPFTVYLQGDGVPGNIQAGDYQAAAGFMLNFQ
ncbi:Fimbria A protein precursor [Serratia fonticola]|uniref:fimbrial protein n=1 Tax=Serratia fonticola TaxID=47917 RepID=UPI00217C41A9|nr:fimbrial protein [Serratia fonticola]CAI2033346.1 Fimbria A protein precursor [Serratia fonticola]